MSVMMFLQYMMVAVWWVPLAASLKNLEVSGSYQAWILSVVPLARLVSLSCAGWPTGAFPA